MVRPALCVALSIALPAFAQTRATKPKPKTTTPTVQPPAPAAAPASDPRPAAPAPAALPEPGKPLVAFPHPLITEVLYAVPSGKEGDADQNGTRSATGDEFVELVNPHDKPINLKGYTLTDGVTAAKGKPKGKPKGEPQIKFTFPDLTLKPGEVVVVFNGYESTPPGPLGDSSHAAAHNNKFHGAYVFTLRVRSQFAALANDGDCVLLSDAEGKPVECVRWGDKDQNPEKPAPLTDDVPESKGSVQRTGVSSAFEPHRNLSGDLGSMLFSPGLFETKPTAAPTPSP